MRVLYDSDSHSWPVTGPLSQWPASMSSMNNRQQAVVEDRGIRTHGLRQRLLRKPSFIEGRRPSQSCWELALSGLVKDRQDVRQARPPVHEGAAIDHGAGARVALAEDARITVRTV